MAFNFAWYRTCNAALRGTLALFCDFRVEGRENVPRRGPLIVVANHQSNMDPPVVGVSLPRPSRFLAKDGLFRLPPAALFLGAYGAHPVRREQADFGAYQWVLEQLKLPNGVMTIFPEGTRSPGKMRRARPGIAALAARSGATLIPVGITGTETFGTYMRVLYPAGRIHVKIGRPFRLQQLKGIDKKTMEEITTEIMARVASLIPAQYHGYYATELGRDWKHTIELDGQLTKPGAGATADAGPAPLPVSGSRGV
ncbi:MAG: 1-acyl-sn-glycerol-3-phosphate acyltransferase [Chloroflexi bacterium]|nr:1-acyl-sn-glycerol-3-phosphate acyltransferase [Chloroflexota bacterium]